MLKGLNSVLLRGDRPGLLDMRDMGLVGMERVGDETGDERYAIERVGVLAHREGPWAVGVPEGGGLQGLAVLKGWGDRRAELLKVCGGRAMGIAGGGAVLGVWGAWKAAAPWEGATLSAL